MAYSGPALEIYAGPRARARLRERGLQAADFRAVPAAAGGPKGLVLNHLDRFLFGSWLVNVARPIHLIGASIGAWRMAAACRAQPVAALAELADDYILQVYPHAPGRQPKAQDISRIFGATLESRLGGARADDILSQQRFRLHVVTSRGRRILSRAGPIATPLGYAGAFAANAIQRRAMAGLIDRVVFSDRREALPFSLADYPTTVARLSRDNLARSVLASCSIPFWLEAVRGIPGGPDGAYWDGGITDYHLHLDYADMADGLVLYPHFQATVVPGWLDKALRHRHRATPKLDNVVLLAPAPAWVKAVMPNGKLPDRGDFKAYGEARVGERQVDWRRAVAEGERLADEFAALARQAHVEARALV